MTSRSLPLLLPLLLLLLLLLLTHTQGSASAQPQAEETRALSLLSPAAVSGKRLLDGQEGSVSPPPRAHVAKATEKQQQEANKKMRGFYGGAGDELHLGGFLQEDKDSSSKNAWNLMMVRRKRRRRRRRRRSASVGSRSRVGTAGSRGEAVVTC
jgi:hypothetical protein